MQLEVQVQLCAPQDNHTPTHKGTFTMFSHFDKKCLIFMLSCNRRWRSVTSNSSSPFLKTSKRPLYLCVSAGAGAGACVGVSAGAGAGASADVQV